MDGGQMRQVRSGTRIGSLSAFVEGTSTIATLSHLLTEEAVPEGPPALRCTRRVGRAGATNVAANAQVRTQSTERVAAALDELRAQGTRITNARVAILEVLSATDAHLSADDVAQAVNAIQPRVHRATVYRTLESLVTAGLVAHTHLGHGTAVYHLTTTPHAHCQCQRCEAVIDVPRTLLRTLSGRLLDDYGFVLDTGHSALLGLCEHCAATVVSHRP